MGLATAKLLASRGAIVSMADINQALLKTARDSLTGSDKHIYTVVDVRDSGQVESWIKYTVQELGKLDGAVNMAGVISPATPITETTDETWNFNFAVNSTGLFYCLRAQLKAISAAGSIVSHLFSLDDAIWLTWKLVGECCQCLWSDGLAWSLPVLCEQSSGDRTLTDCSQRK